MTRTEPKRLVWLARASAERDAQILYIAERRPNAAVRADDAIQNAVDRIARFPESARPGRTPGTRELVVPRTSFVIIYRIASDAVVILRLLHQRQRRP